MGAFGGLILTNKGRALQNKAQSGVQLVYSRIGLGDGSLNGQSISGLTALVSEKKTLPITKAKLLPDGKFVVGGVLSNQTVSTGFYFREIGVFAIDPDLGEILYCYGNAGTNAEYIPAANGADIIEKSIDVVTVTGNASSVSATIDQSQVYVLTSNFDAHTHDGMPGNGPKITASGLANGAVTDAVFGTRTIDDTKAAAAGADAPTNLWSKLANMIKQITGKPNWYTAPAISLETVSGRLNQAVNTTSSPSFTGLNLGASTGFKSKLYNDGSNIQMGFGVDLAGGPYEMDIAIAQGPVNQGYLNVGTISNSDGTTFSGGLFQVHANGKVNSKNNIFDDGFGNATLANTVNGNPAPYVAIANNTAAGQNPGSGRITVYHDSSQSVYSGMVALEPWYYDGAQYAWRTKALTVEASGAVRTPRNLLDDGSGYASFAGGATFMPTTGGTTYNGNWQITRTSERYPYISLRDGTTLKSQILGDANSGTMYVDVGGSLYVRNAPNSGAVIMSLSNAGALAAKVNVLDDGLGNTSFGSIGVKNTDYQVQLDTKAANQYALIYLADNGTYKWFMGKANNHDFVVNNRTANNNALVIKASNSAMYSLNNTLDDGSGGSSFKGLLNITTSGNDSLWQRRTNWDSGDTFKQNVSGTNDGPTLSWVFGDASATTETVLLYANGLSWAVGTKNNVIDDGTGKATFKSVVIKPDNASGIQTGLTLIDTGSGANEGTSINWQANGAQNLASVVGISQASGGKLIFRAASDNTGSSLVDTMTVTSAGARIYGNTNPLIVSRMDNTNKMITVQYDGTNDYGTIQSLENGVAYKPLKLNPSGGSVLTVKNTLDDGSGGMISVSTFRPYLGLYTPIQSVNGVVAWSFDSYAGSTDMASIAWVRNTSNSRAFQVYNNTTSTELFAVKSDGRSFGKSLAVADFGNEIHSAPWYGMGLASITGDSGNGNYNQVAGYYGLRLRTGATILDLSEFAAVGAKLWNPMNINYGGAALVLNGATGAADHVYMEFYADSQNPNTRSGWLGFGSSGNIDMLMSNEMGGNVNIATTGSGKVQVNGNEIATKNDVAGANIGDINTRSWTKASGNVSSSSNINTWVQYPATSAVGAHNTNEYNNTTYTFTAAASGIYLITGYHETSISNFTVTTSGNAATYSIGCKINGANPTDNITIARFPFDTSASHTFWMESGGFSRAVKLNAGDTLSFFGGMFTGLYSSGTWNSTIVFDITRIA